MRFTVQLAFMSVYQKLCKNSGAVQRVWRKVCTNQLFKLEISVPGPILTYFQEELDIIRDAHASRTVGIVVAQDNLDSVHSTASASKKV